jgi:hypothetical protein
MQLYLAWVAYFYLTMALRECVLLVNGSQIRPWWVQHHYWSAACSLVMLALPVSSPSEWGAWGLRDAPGARRARRARGVAGPAR